MLLTLILLLLNLYFSSQHNLFVLMVSLFIELCFDIQKLYCSLYESIIFFIFVFQTGTSFQYKERRSCFVLSNDKRKGVLWYYFCCWCFKRIFHVIEHRVDHLSLLHHKNEENLQRLKKPSQEQDILHNVYPFIILLIQPISLANHTSFWERAKELIFRDIFVRVI